MIRLPSIVKGKGLTFILLQKLASASPGDGGAFPSPTLVPAEGASESSLQADSPVSSHSPPVMGFYARSEVTEYVQLRSRQKK